MLTFVRELDSAVRSQSLLWIISGRTYRTLALIKSFCYGCSIIHSFLLVEFMPVKVLAFPSNNNHRERDPFLRRRIVKWTL